MQSKCFHRSCSFVSACCLTFAVLGTSLIQAAEFKPFLTVQLAGPDVLISIAEKAVGSVQEPEFTQNIAMAASYKNLPGVNNTGTIGLAIQANDESILGVDILISLPISNFTTFNIPGLEPMIDGFRAMAQRQGNKYTFATPFGEVVAQQRQGFLIVATADAAEFADTIDPQTLFAEVSDFTLGVNINKENITAETAETILGSISMILATQGVKFDPEEFISVFNEGLGPGAAVLAEMASITYGVTVDPQTLDISGITKTVAKTGTKLAEKFTKSKEALEKTKMGVFLPDTPQTIFSWHCLNYFTDREIERIKGAWELIGEGLIEGIHESAEDEDIDEKQLEKLIAAAEAFLEYTDEVMDFFARERLLDSAFWLDSEGTCIMAIATDKTAELVVLDEKFFGKLLEIFGDKVSTFIENTMDRNYETVAGYSLSCMFDIFAYLPADIGLPEGTRNILANISVHLFWAVKEGEALVYAVGLDFDKTEQALKTAMAAMSVSPKQTMVIAPKPAVKFFMNKIVPLIPDIPQSDLEQMSEVLTAFTTQAGANAQIVGTEEYTAASYTQKTQMPGELVIAVFDVLLRPAVTAARGAAQRTQCSNNMKMLGLAFHTYADMTPQTYLPPLYSMNADGKPLHSWRVYLLPFLEQTALYDQIRLNEPWDSPHNKQFHDMMPAVFQCPDNPGKGCCYATISGVLVPVKDGDWNARSTMVWSAKGTSNQILIVEVKEPFNWMDPTADITLDELAKGINKAGRVGSFQPGGCNVGFGDGSVRFITDAVDGALLRALGDPRDGQGRGSMLP